MRQDHEFEREVTRLPQQPERMETGPMRFGQDWTGVFIRGDDAIMYRTALETLHERYKADDSMMDIDDRIIAGLIGLLGSCEHK